MKAYIFFFFRYFSLRKFPALFSIVVNRTKSVLFAAKHISFCLISYRPEDSIRLERMPDRQFDHSAALNRITEFYEEQRPVRNADVCKVNVTRESNEQEKCSALEMILKVPKSVQTCFAALIQYLKDFKLERILRLTRYVYVHVLLSVIIEQCMSQS